MVICAESGGEVQWWSAYLACTDSGFTYSSTAKNRKAKDKGGRRRVSEDRTGRSVGGVRERQGGERDWFYQSSHSVVSAQWFLVNEAFLLPARLGCQDTGPSLPVPPVPLTPFTAISLSLM